MRKLIIIATLLCYVMFAFGQKSKDELMVVYLKDGSMIEGFITEWNNGEALKLTSRNGKMSYNFPADKIEKVQQRSLISMMSEVPYSFNETGTYLAWRGQGIIGNDGSRANEIPGYGFSFLAGYRIHRLIGVGVGVGYDKFIDDSSEAVIPVFTEISGYAIPKNTSLFYSLAVGYSFAKRDTDNALLTEAEGGLLVYPAIGLRFGRNKIKYTIDLGYKFQNASFTYLDPWNGSTSSEQNLRYKRLTLRFGIMI